MKKGSYKVRRFKRRIRRKWWVFRLRAKRQIQLSIYFSLIGIVKIYYFLFSKKILRVTRIGESIYEGRKERKNGR